MVGIGLPYALADIRDDIEKHKNRIDVLDKKIIELNKDIIDTKKKINENQEKFEKAEKHEKTLRNRLGVSWDAHKDLEEAQDEVRKAEIILKASKDKLIEIFDDRNEAIKEISDLEDLIDKLDSSIAVKTPSRIFGITVDNTCLSYLKNNLSSNCPTFEDIELFYPDSGCPYPDVKCLNYYKQIGGTRYILDPPAGVMERIKMINIRYNFDEYHIQGSGGYNETEHTINYGVGRYIDGCKDAYIDSDSWLYYIGFTINLLHHDCDEAYNYLGETRTDQLNKTVHDIATSYKWQHEAWLKEVGEKCLSKCFEY